MTLLSFNYPAAFAENCDTPLLTQTQIHQYTQKELNKALKDSKGFLHSTALRLMQKKLTRKIIERCTPLQNCPPETLGKIVEQEIIAMDQKASSFANKPKIIRGHAIIIGSMVSAGFASSYALTNLPEDGKWLAALITPVSAAVIWAMGATYLKRTQGYFEALGFRITSTNSNNSSIAADELDEIFNQIQTTYTAPQQSSRSVMNGFMSSMRTGLNSALIILSEGYSPKAENIISSQLAEVLLYSARYFQDVPLNQESIGHSIQLLVTDHIPSPTDRALLLEVTLKKIEYKNAELARKSRTVLESWLKTNSKTSS